MFLCTRIYSLNIIKRNGRVFTWLPGVKYNIESPPLAIKRLTLAFFIFHVASVFRELYSYHFAYITLLLCLSKLVFQSSHTRRKPKMFSPNKLTQKNVKRSPDRKQSVGDFCRQMISKPDNFQSVIHFWHLLTKRVPRPNQTLFAWVLWGSWELLNESWCLDWSNSTRCFGVYVRCIACVATLIGQRRRKMSQIWVFEIVKVVLLCKH